MRKWFVWLSMWLSLGLSLLSCGGDSTQQAGRLAAAEETTLIPRHVEYAPGFLAQEADVARAQFDSPTTTTTSPPEPARRAQGTRQPVSRSGTTRTAQKPAAGIYDNQPTGDLIDALARCESGMRNLNTGNGYFSYFQWSPKTWWSLTHPGQRYDRNASIASVMSTSYAVQKSIVATKIPVSAWDTQFPGCAKKLRVA